MGEMKVEHVLLFLVGAFLIYHMVKIEGISNCRFSTHDIGESIWLKGKLVGTELDSQSVRVIPETQGHGKRMFWMNCEDIMKR